MKRVLADPLSQLQETARHISDVSNECKLPMAQDEYVESFRPTLMDVVHAWSKVGPTVTSSAVELWSQTKQLHHQDLPFHRTVTVALVRSLTIWEYQVSVAMTYALPSAGLILCHHMRDDRHF